MCLVKNLQIQKMETSDFQIAQQTSISFSTDSMADYCKITGIVGAAKLTISNIYCKVFLTKEHVENEDIISLESLPKGVYILKIISESGTVRRKLEKK
jgi:hypothetical protein